MTTPEYQKFVLPNGMTVVAERHLHVRSLSIGLWVKVGSQFESPRINGISHFIEHMLFKGTETRNALEIATVLECLGGELNAFTDREMTCYHATVLQEHLEVALDVISDLVIRPLFDAKEMERERKVLLQELSMVEESPEERIADIFFQSIWKDQALGQTVIGTKKTISTIKRSEVLNYYRQFYHPKNIVLSVAGSIDFAKLKAMCAKYFNFPETPSKFPNPPHTVYKKRKRLLKAATEQLHLMVGFEGVSFKDDYRFDALILSFFLGGGMSSRLFQEIREKAGLAYTVECECVPFSETGTFSIYLATSPKALSKCLAIIGREINRLKETPLTKVEIDLVKGQLKGTILLCSDQMEIRQESLGRNEVVFGRYISVEEVIQEIERVSPERIRELAQKLFTKEKESLIVLTKNQASLTKMSIFGDTK